MHFIIHEWNFINAKSGDGILVGTRQKKINFTYKFSLGKKIIFILGKKKEERKEYYVAILSTC